MKKYLSFIMLIAALTYSGSAMATAGNYTFDWVGQCTDCTGQATATLDVTDYVLGSDFNTSNFVKFHYDFAGIFPAYTILQNDQLILTGSISALPGSYSVNIFQSDPSLQFHTVPDYNFWSTGRTTVEDYGNITSGTWTLAASSAVPEPATWALMLAGFALTGAAIRWRQATPAKVNYFFRS